MEKKIGILNLTWLNDYGSALLTYSVQKMLKRKGYDSESINFFPSEPNENGEAASILPEVRPASKQKSEHFKTFREKFLSLSDRKYIGVNPENVEHYDTIVLGSDLLWTPLSLLHPENPRLYAEYYYHFLKFADDSTQKIAWSCSIGTDNEQDLNAMKPVFRKELKEFNYISIREKDSAEYIQTLTEKPVYNLCDPVLNLDMEDFDEILPHTSVQPDYIYSYLITGHEAAYEATNSVSERSGLPVVSNTGDSGKIRNLAKECSGDGPGEFVEKIRNASIVITDSYHAVILAILAKKNFICYPIPKIALRLKNILKMFGLSERLITDDADPVEILNHPIDWEYVFEVLKAQRAKTDEFLDRFL